MSSCIASDDALLRWTLATKRKMIVKKYGLPSGLLVHSTVLSEVTMSYAECGALGARPTEGECKH
jgi:hypothetical protein